MNTVKEQMILYLDQGYLPDEAYTLAVQDIENFYDSHNELRKEQRYEQDLESDTERTESPKGSDK